MALHDLSQKLSLPSKETALVGRDQAIILENQHYVHGRPICPPFDIENIDASGFERTTELQQVCFGLGCFWGAERKFWSLQGVYTTAVGYGAGITPNPIYEEVCSGLTGHNELVLAVYDPAQINFSALLSVFFESHNPTQGMRQGNDIGTQYRSGIYYFSESQKQQAQQALQHYQQSLNAAGYGSITTEILPMDNFYYAEQYHQQYLAKNPNGYCGLGGLGIDCSLTA